MNAMFFAYGMGYRLYFFLLSRIRKRWSGTHRGPRSFREASFFCSLPSAESCGCQVIMVSLLYNHLASNSLRNCQDLGHQLLELMDSQRLGSVLQCFIRVGVD